MRILHTSDWHLGRSFHREGMLTHQAAYVDHLLEVVDAEQVDLVVVAGDIYDRALPHVDAVRLADEALARLAASRASVVLTSGNHDSAQRLGFSSRLIDAAGVFIRTDAGTVGTPVLLEDAHGPVAVHGIPYLDPDSVREPWQLSGRSHEAALTEAMRRIRADLDGRGPGTRSVVLAHAFVAGAEPSDSERDISVGGVSIVPTSVFDGIDYAALGHLHGRHTLTESVRYSGSPLAYSFSEATHRKGSWLVELGRDGLATTEFVEAPVPRPLARLRGTLAELLADAGAGGARGLLGPGHPHRRRAPPAGDGPAPGPLPAHAGARLRARLGGRPGGARRPAPGAQRPRHRPGLRRRDARCRRDRRGVGAAAGRLRRLLRGSGLRRPRPRGGLLMRLHHLEVTAFGPFAGHVVVDLDRLSEAGLFLLSGPTGAGKTSILDAICFALYGDVPGDRSAAKRLRCDQAAPGVAPVVTLEATLAGRRFRIVRSPAWERPKKRGSGTTTQQASVTISERVDGAWLPLSSRLDETGHLVARLVGMNLAQFTQVAMLPQGRFQAFLRARSEERHQLLQRLFRTGRFEDVEGWLRDRRVALRRQSEACHQAVAELVSRISEATDAGLPDEWDVRDLAAPAADGALAGWAAGLCEDAADRRVRADRRATAAAATEAEAHARLDAARSLLERRARLDAAAREHERLLAETGQVDTTRRTLDAARRAASVVPVHRMVATAAAACERAQRAAAETSTAAADSLGLLLVDRDTLDRAVAAAADASAAVRATLPRQARLEAVDAEVSTVEARRRDLAARIAVAQQEQAALPERVSTLREELTRAEAARAELEPARVRLAELEGRAAARAEVDVLGAELEDARTEWLEVRELALARHEQLLALRQARIEGMAAEIAGALAVGACCPVCGSADHPDKASPAPGAPDGAAEKSAQKALDDAKADEHARDLKVRDLGTRLATASGRAGGSTADQLEAERRAVQEEIARLTATSGRREALERELTTAVAAHERLGGELRELELESATLGSRASHLHQEAVELRRVLDDLLDGTGCADLAALLDAHLERAAAGRAAVQALDALTSAESSLAEAAAALAAAVEEAGFASAADAVSAARPAAESDALATRVADHDRRLSVVTAVLAEPGAEELARSAVPDLDALTAARSEALAALGDARADASLWTARHQRLTGLLDRLHEALTTWAPVLESVRLTNHLSAFVEGKAPDNRLQMRLSGYVLAYRLSQVVAAANERLARMSDQRYSLEHTGRRGAGETRGGLSLVVRDDWSGETRDPATLSGGETFVVSLALALGLADVITQEAGGADLDTLFVDEGFGSLDADTLDDVMDTLDSLRDGGRVVGVVSHVAEMRDRIPTQLVVTKARRGSTVAVTS